ncbi:MAG: glycoside hydrolase family 16 protein [Flavobacteriaceae bacterium]
MNGPHRILLFLGLILLVNCREQSAKQKVNKPAVILDQPLKLVWSDEFDYEGVPDEQKWKHQTIGPNQGQWFNGEQQHYTASEKNAYVSNGTLKIIALQEEITTNGVPKMYSSARLNSTFPFTYGKIEVKAKLPQGRGTWPAIWTLGTNINELGNPFGDEFGSVGWPNCGEIDIMEQNGWQKSKTIGHLHWGNTKTGKYENQGSTYELKTSSKNYHIYSAIWNKDSIHIQVNQQTFLSIKNSEELPYDNPHYLLLNLAVGGNLGGNLPDQWEPQVFEIDYVRIYQ